MLAPYKGTDVGATPTGTTIMKKYKYLHKLVEIKYDGKKELGFVIEEFIDHYGGNQVRVLLQETKQTIFFDTKFFTPKVLEE
jgi:hypothetical protein